MAAKKQYGLILPKNKVTKTQLLNKPSVFDDGSSDEENEDSRRKQVNSSLHKEGIKRLEARTTRNRLTAALTEDPTVFDYDGIYEDMQEKKRATDAKHKEKRETKSKYIASLKRTAEVRKVEQELAYERKVQKERETEGELYSDKDAFVTPGYIKKLEERVAIEERLKREEEIEKLNDVTKQTDLSKFYRNMLNRKTAGVTSRSVEDETDIEVVRERQQPREEDDQRDSEGVKEASMSPVEAKVTEKRLSEDEEEDKLLVEDQIEEDQPSDGEQGDQSLTSELETQPVTQEKDQPRKETIEERRKRIFAKRTNDESALSAKERYLSRKRAKLSEPVIINEDD